LKRSFGRRRNIKSTKQKVLVTALIIFAVVFALGIAVPPTKAAANVTVSQYGYYDTLLQGYYVFGEVTNNGDKPVTNITVNVKCYDATNNLLSASPVKGYIDGPNIANANYPFVLNPGAITPFKIQINKGDMSFRNQDINHLTSTVSFNECDALPEKLEITVSGVYQIPGLAPNIRGTVKNTGTSKADEVFVYVIGYDSNKAVIGPYGQMATTEGGGNSVNPGESANFSLNALLFPVSGETGINAASFIVTAQSFVGSNTVFTAQYAATNEIEGTIQSSSPSPSLSPSSSAILNPAPSVSPAVSSSPTPTPTATPQPVVSNENIWVPQPANAVAATAASIAAVSVVSVIASAVNSPVGESAGGFIEKFKDFMPESVKNWLQDKRKTKVEEKKHSPFRPTKMEIVAYITCVLTLALGYSFVKAEDLTQLLSILPTMVAVGFIGGFVKTYLAVTFTRSRGIWNEHAVWYLGLATFVLTALAFRMPFAWPSRTVHSESDLLKRKEGILSTVDILISVAFSAAFFILLLEGFELVGSIGLAMCLSVAFFDSLPIRPMSGRHVFKFSKILWLALFLICLVLLVSWLMLM
jgi:hypothetical protein